MHLVVGCFIKKNFNIIFGFCYSVAAWKEANQGVLTTKMKAEVPNSGYRHPYQRPISRKTASPSSSDMRKSNVEGRDETVLAPLSLFHFGGFYKLARYIISVFQPLLYINNLFFNFH